MPTGVQDVLVVIPAQVEGSQILRTVATTLSCCDRADVVLVNDESENGNGLIAEYLSTLNSRIHAVRTRQNGRQEAPCAAGFRWGLQRQYQYFVQMKADESHDPRFIPGLLERMTTCDLVIGSRYCTSGGVVGRAISRNLLSSASNMFLRMLLRVPIRDLTSDFKCWRRRLIRSIDPRQVGCDEKAFHVQMSYLAHSLGARIAEVPIVYVGRLARRSKTLGRAVADLARKVLDLASLQWSARSRPALANLRTRYERKDETRPQKVLFLALGGIGDTVLTFAAARRLRALFPRDHLTALAMWPQSAELLEDLGVFDEVLHHHFQLQPWWKSLALVLRLHRRRFDMSVLAFPANRFEYNLVQWLIHAKRRLGHEYLRGSNLAYLRWLLTDRVEQTLGTHNVLENLRLLEPSGVSHVRAPDLTPDNSLGPLAPEYRVFAEQTVADVNGPLIGIHAGSSSYKNLSAKRWPSERFAELCDRALTEEGLIPFLFGSEQDQEVNRVIRARCRVARIIVTPSIRHTAALIQRCSVFVSNDTALAHLASALDVPTVMLVGPTDGLEVGPYASNGCVVSASPNCAPCFRVSRAPLKCRHPNRHACMTMIEVSRVLQEVRNVLRASPRQSPVTESGQRAYACEHDAAPLGAAPGLVSHQGTNGPRG